jgi:hypothetical protein
VQRPVSHRFEAQATAAAALINAHRRALRQKKNSMQFEAVDRAITPPVAAQPAHSISVTRCGQYTPLRFCTPGGGLC